MKAAQNEQGNALLLVIVLVEFLIIGGMGYYIYTQKTNIAPVATAAPVYKTIAPSTSPVMPSSQNSSLTPTQSQDNPFESSDNPFNNLQ